MLKAPRVTFRTLSFREPLRVSLFSYTTATFAISFFFYRNSLRGFVVCPRIEVPVHNLQIQESYRIFQSSIAGFFAFWHSRVMFFLFFPPGLGFCFSQVSFFQPCLFCFSRVFLFSWSSFFAGSNLFPAGSAILFPLCRYVR